uniref:Transcription factor AP-2 C-terminal domain-containing protein n=1 Tax=Meloidogyne incognita TaxID=6306 RepID=A0A914MFG7_MELIC
MNISFGLCPPFCFYFFSFYHSKELLFVRAEAPCSGIKSYGVELTSGRRRQVQLTCFSSLVEEEVAQIASDFNLVNSKHYPLKEVAKYVLGDIEVHNSQDASMYRRMGLFYASALLQRILDLHRADRTPLADSFLKFDPRTPHLDEKLQHELSNYTLLTHGFGGRTFIEVLETV